MVPLFSQKQTVKNIFVHQLLHELGTIQLLSGCLFRPASRYILSAAYSPSVRYCADSKKATKQVWYLFLGETQPNVAAAFTKCSRNAVDTVFEKACWCGNGCLFPNLQKNVHKLISGTFWHCSLVKGQLVGASSIC